jgi:hypothetical protein
VVLVVLLIGTGALVGCTDDAPVASNIVPPPATAGTRVSFVTLGGNETIRGLDESVNQPWNQQVFTSLPLGATFANLGSRDATAADALTEQLPKALAEQPTLAVVWLGSGDASKHTSTASFSTSLTAIVTGLRASGAKVLLIARTTADTSGVTPYLTVVADVAATTGATLVRIEGHDSLRSPAEHQAIADAVRAAL